VIKRTDAAATPSARRFFRRYRRHAARCFIVYAAALRVDAPPRFTFERPPSLPPARRRRHADVYVRLPIIFPYHYHVRSRIRCAQAKITRADAQVRSAVRDSQAALRCAPRYTMRGRPPQCQMRCAAVAQHLTRCEKSPCCKEVACVLRRKMRRTAYKHSAAVRKERITLPPAAAAFRPSLSPPARSMVTPPTLTRHAASPSVCATTRGLFFVHPSLRLLRTPPPVHDGRQVPPRYHDASQPVLRRRHAVVVATSRRHADMPCHRTPADDARRCPTRCLIRLPVCAAPHHERLLPLIQMRRSA